MAQSKALAPIIKRYRAKRIKRENPWQPQRIIFETSADAAQAVWEISRDTGRECFSSGNIVSVYP